MWTPLTPAQGFRGVSSRRISGRSIHHTYIIYLFGENCNSFSEVYEKFTYSTPKTGNSLAASYPFGRMKYSQRSVSVHEGRFSAQSGSSTSGETR